MIYICLMASFFPYLSDHRNKDGTYTLFIRITTYYEKAKLSTEHRIHKSDWNPVKKEVRVSHHNYSGLNSSLTNLCRTLEKIYTDSKGQGKDLKAAEIKLIWEETKGAGTSSLSSPDFIAFCNDYFDKLEAAGKWNTVAGRRGILNKFKNWLGRDQIGFNEITGKLMEDYKMFLLTKNKKSTVHANIKKLAEQFNRANRLGIFTGAFPHVQIDKGKTHKLKLTPEEIKILETKDLPEILHHVRNYFLFSFYCAGIRFSDICMLTRSMINNGRLKYSMRKTDNEKDRILHPKAIEILKQYSGAGYLFPIIDSAWYGRKLNAQERNILTRHISSCNANVNRQLKRIAEICEINKPISFHTSRHSFADIARKKKVSTQVISELLGHSSIAITQAYFGSGFDDDTLDDAMKNIID